MDAGAPPPQVEVLNLITAHWMQRAICIAAELGIADLVANGTSGVDELAKASGTHAASLYRVLRLLASRGIFRELESRKFALTPLAEPLRSDVPGSMRAFARFMGAPFYAKWWNDPLQSVRTGRSTIEIETGKNGFEWLQEHPEASKIFDAAMTDYSHGVHRAVVAAYPFAGTKTLCDVGGGQGALLALILQANPGMQGILFDQPHVAGPAKERFAKAGLAARARVETGSFFEKVPPGADAYILSHIIHDWDDERSLVILSKCRQAISKGGRVLLSEIVLPGLNAPSFGKGLDFEMLVATPGGRERTEQEYRDLFSAAGLKLTRIVPTQAHVSVIEGVG